MNVKSYRLENYNLKNKCFSIHHYKTLKQAEDHGFRHTFLEYYRYNQFMPKNIRLFCVWESELNIV